MTGTSRTACWIAGVGLLLLSGCGTNTGATAEAPGAGFSGDTQELATASDQTAKQRRADIRLNLAVGYYERRQFDVALDEIKQALNILPEMADAYSVRALIYMEIDENALADANFKRALGLSPNNPDYMSNYGWFLCQRGRPAESIEYFDKALASHNYQSPSRALANAGVCSLKLNKPDDANRYFQQSLQFEPLNALSNANLAMSSARKGDRQRAEFYVGQLTKAGQLSAQVLWAAIKTERLLGNQTLESDFVRQLTAQYPNSAELIAYRRGVFDE